MLDNWVGDTIWETPKGFNKGYHEMTYTKFGVGRSFCQNEVGRGWGGGEGAYNCVYRKGQIVAVLHEK